MPAETNLVVSFVELILWIFFCGLKLTIEHVGSGVSQKGSDASQVQVMPVLGLGLHGRSNKAIDSW